MTLTAHNKKFPIFLLFFFLSNPLVWASEKNISFFPIFYSSSDKTTTDSHTYISALSPIFEYSSKDNEHFLAFHPLFSQTKSTTTTELDILYPIFRYTGKKTDTPQIKEEKKWILFPLFVKRNRTLNNNIKLKTTVLFPIFFYGRYSDGKGYLIILPFIFYAKNSPVFVPIYLPSKQNFEAFFPLYGNFKKFLGKDSLKFFLFPLFVHSEKKEMKCTSIIWPIFGLFYGEKISGFRLFPLFGFAKKINEEDKIETSAYFIWPLGHHKRYPASIKKSTPPISLDMFFPFFINFKKGNTIIEYYFPFWGRKKSSNQSTTSYLFPFLMVTKNTKDKFSQYRFFGILFNRKTGETKKETQLFPFYGVKKRTNYKRNYVLWPFYTSAEDKMKNVNYKRKYLFPFYISQKKEFNDGSIEKKSCLFPFFGKKKLRDGNISFQTLWLFWYTEDKGIDRNWAPLWAFYKSTKKLNGDFCKSVFGRLYYSEQCDGKKKKEINLFIYRYSSNNKESRHTFFGLISLKKKS